MDLPRGQFECIIHTFCVLSLPRPTRLFSRQTTAKCVHMFDSGIRNFNQNHIERAYAARARKKRFLKSDRKEKGAQIELKKCFLNYTNVTHGIPVSWNIQALPLSLLFLLFFFFLFLLHFGRRVTLRTLSFAQIAWPATPSKRDECKWAGKDLGVSRLFFFGLFFFCCFFGDRNDTPAACFASDSLAFVWTFEVRPRDSALGTHFRTYRNEKHI